MSTIDTVRGPVALDALGQTLAHEHVLFIDSEFVRFYPELAWGGDRSVVVDTSWRSSRTSAIAASRRSSTAPHCCMDGIWTSCVR